jgi:hypothetical protein
MRFFTASLIAAGLAFATTYATSAPVLSNTVAVKTAAEPSAITVRCWTGPQWSALGFAGVLRPGTLAVGSYYNSTAYGYSGFPQYYGEGYPPYYNCDYPPPYYGYVRKHRRVRASVYNR